MQSPIKATHDIATFSEGMANRAFNLNCQVTSNTLLVDWQAVAQEMIITPKEQKRLTELHQKLFIRFRWWNEQELREKFIIPLTELVDFDMVDIEVASFSGRPIEVVYKQYLIKGKVRWMVAIRGINRHPLFVINDFQYEEESESDPMGQLLTTLVVAKLFNENPPAHPLFNPNPKSFPYIPSYGCYILGQMWFFVHLKDQQYHVSSAYDSTKEEHLQVIFKMLKAQKQMIRDLIK